MAVSLSELIGRYGVPVPLCEVYRANALPADEFEFCRNLAAVQSKSNGYHVKTKIKEDDKDAT